MKKVVSFLLVAVMLFSLSACTPQKYRVAGDRKILKKFSDTMTIEEIFKDIENVDLYHKMNTEGLSQEITENEESATTDIILKDADGNIIYETGKGYGEDFFKYHTKSVSGKDIVCNYVDEGYKSVFIDCDSYYVSLTNLDKSEPFGAEHIYVESKTSDKSILNNCICYEYVDKWIPNAYFADEKGYHLYSTYIDNIGWAKSVDYIKYERLTEKPNTDTKILTAKELTIKPEFVFGKHKYSYLDEMTGQWYLTADFVLTFETEKDRENFMKKYNIKPSSTSGNEDEYITLRTGEITVPIAENCKGFKKSLDTFEVDDYTYNSVSVNDKGEITELSSSSNYSYY